MTSLVAAQEFSALARLVPEESRIVASESGVSVDLRLSQAVPFRVFAVTDPVRVVVDFREVSFGQWADSVGVAAPLVEVAAGAAREVGWSRLVLTLNEPMSPTIAAMTTDAETGQATVTLELEPVSAAEFEELARDAAEVQTTHQTAEATVAGDERFTVVLDPGHGGVDPGAVRGDVTEAGLALIFARELRDALRRTGEIDVVLTRDADVFVPLPTRVTIARSAEADAFLSIHVDALAEGRARGATVYTLAETATDAAAAALAEQHDRADLLAGIDLHGSDDIVAGVLMDLARVETAPRSSALANGLVAGLSSADIRLHSRPRGEAGFTVLRAADIPSVLVEIGFMSDPQDLANIQDPEWRARMQEAMVQTILTWADEDAARTALSRQ